MYTSYRVDAVNSMKGVQPPTGSKLGDSSVRRRYSDFQWLYQRFVTERAGAIVPIIPHRRALSTEARVSDELVKERRVHLENFLQTVVAHPELQDAPSLSAFLKAEAGEAFDAAKKELEKVNPNSNTNHDSDYSESASLTSNETNATGKIRNLFARTAVAVSVMGGSTELERTEDENEIEEIQQYVDGLSTHTKTLVTQASLLVKSTNDCATGLRVISQSAFGWAQTHQQRYCPGGTDATVNTMGKISSSTSDISTLANQKGALEATKLEQSLQELSRMVSAIKIALSKRREWSLTYTTRLKQITNRQASLGKLQRAGKINKVPQAQLDLATAEREAHSARKELDEVSQRVLREMDRIQNDLDRHLAHAMNGYAAVQIEYNQKMQEAWSKLVPQLADNAATASTVGGTPSAPPEQEMFSMLKPIPAADSESKLEQDEDLLL